MLAALAHHGHEAHPLLEAGEEYVVIPRPEGRRDVEAWREEVRDAISRADSSRVDPVPVRGPVRFVDEAGGTPPPLS